MVFTSCALTRGRNCEWDRLTWLVRNGWRDSSSKKASSATGHSQWRQAGGFGGADGAGLSPGGGGVTCFDTPTSYPRARRNQVNVAPLPVGSPYRLSLMAKASPDS